MKTENMVVLALVGIAAYMLYKNRQTVYKLPSGADMVYDNGKLVPLTSVFPVTKTPTITIESGVSDQLVWDNGQLVPIASIFGNSWNT